MKKFVYLLIVLFLPGCKGEEPVEPSADTIIAQAIEKAGGDNYHRARISFNFRGRQYTSSRQGGIYEYTRSFMDSVGQVKDVLDNNGFRRYREGQEVYLPDSTAQAYAESVNSVHYFVQLPFGLQGPAVQKKWLGTDSISGSAYHQIQVTFREKGGGKDHEDIYMYWVDQEDLTVDYMAYRFFVNEGGIRFRVAVNPRVRKGIRFVDYKNYKTEKLSTPLDSLDELYMKGKLTLVSLIQNNDLDVELLERIDQ